MKPRVLITESIAPSGIETLEGGGLEVDVRTGLTPDELLEAIGGYDGLIIRSATKVTSEVIDAGARLKVVGRAGIGVDNVDVTAATRRGIVVVNTPQGNIVSTAEHTVALMLALARQIPQAHAALTSGRWEKKRFAGVELSGKVVGIVGLGRVGTLVAQRCHSFGMRIIARDPYLAPQRAQRLGIDLVEMDELLEQADVISLHVVKTPETHHMIGERELARCKDGVLIVNVSRGGVVDEDALARAISSGKVGGAALDVFETEPLTDSPLFGLDRVVVTPHIAGQTAEAQDKAGTIAAEQVLLALRGEFVPNAVNLEAGGELPELLRPFLRLATRLGRLVAALAGEGVGALEVAYHGPVASEDTRVLTLSALRGFLQAGVHEPVTYVNAPMVASDRGIDYTETRSAASTDYTNLVRVTARRDGEPVVVGGTLVGRANEERVVEIDGRPLEIALTRYMAFFRYDDRPGVVHRASGPLADADINIKNMVVAEPPSPGEPAVMALAVDSPIPAEVLEAAMEAAGIRSGRFVVLEEG
ncbi:MAG TPA: phosphoglycerate dehydrogenase [Actinomycetota bacterium]|nr:phosphoglycerate dehydrogenase [Actinomycetota bacterium]